MDAILDLGDPAGFGGSGGDPAGFGGSVGDPAGFVGV